MNKQGCDPARKGHGNGALMRQKKTLHTSETRRRRNDDTE